MTNLNYYAAGFFTIVVVCSHIGRPNEGRERVVARLSWLDTEPEFEALLRADEKEHDEAALQAVLLNDRFAYREEWTNRIGRKVEPPKPTVTYWIGEPKYERAIEKTGALGAFRFRCRCGVDRPVRQATLDEWIRTELAGGSGKRVYPFDIAR